MKIVGIVTLSPFPSSPITIFEISSWGSLSAIIANLAPAAAAFKALVTKVHPPLVINTKGVDYFFPSEFSLINLNGVQAS